MTQEEQKNKCTKCQYCIKLESNICYNFKFLGCRYGNYKGKWVAEIEKCPKSGKDKCDE